MIGLTMVDGFARGTAARAVVFLKKKTVVIKTFGSILRWGGGGIHNFFFLLNVPIWNYIFYIEKMRIG